MEYIKELKLDVAGGTSFINVSAKQNDNKSRFIKIILYDGRNKFNLPEGATAQIRARKPDGKPVLNDAVINNDDSITVELTEQMLAVAGKVKAEISILDDEGVTLTSCTFVINVNPTVCALNQIESSHEFKTLNTALSAVQKIIEAKNNGEFNGKDGRDGADGAKGDTGNTGPQGPPGKDAVTDSKLDANSNNAISNSAVSIAISEIVEQLKNGIITDY